MTPLPQIRLQHAVLGHPSTLFAAIWLAAIALIRLDIIEVFSEYAADVTFIGAILITANLIGAAVSTIFTRSIRLCASGEIEVLSLERLSYVWLAITLVETVISGGLPLAWLLTGSGKTYEDFGVPTVHGFANAIWLFITFTRIVGPLKLRRGQLNKWVLAALIGWPILAVSRALLTILILQALVYFILTSKKSVPTLTLRTLLFFASFSILFGIAGNLRAPEFSIAAALGVEEESLFISFAWVYAYMVSPLANLALNWTTESPAYSLIPGNTLAGLLPSVIRMQLGIETGFDGYLGSLAHDAFNVGTAFLAIFFDWGPVGVLLMAAFIGAFGHAIWCRARREPGSIPLLAAFNACVVLTIFTNQFTQLTPLLYMLMLRFLCKTQKT